MLHLLPNLNSIILPRKRSLARKGKEVKMKTRMTQKATLPIAEGLGQINLHPLKKGNNLQILVQKAADLNQKPAKMNKVIAMWIATMIKTKWRFYSRLLLRLLLRNLRARKAKKIRRVRIRANLRKRCSKF